MDKDVSQEVRDLSAADRQCRAVPSVIDRRGVAEVCAPCRRLYGIGRDNAHSRGQATAEIVRILALRAEHGRYHRWGGYQVALGSSSFRVLELECSPKSFVTNVICHEDHVNGKTGPAPFMLI